MTAIAGLLGGIIHWVTNRLSWRNGLLCLVVGAISAVYLGPIMIAPILTNGFGVDGDPAMALGGFLIGVSGIAFQGTIIDLLKGRLGASLKETKEREVKDE